MREVEFKEYLRLICKQTNNGITSYVNGCKRIENDMLRQDLDIVVSNNCLYERALLEMEAFAGNRHTANNLKAYFRKYKKFTEEKVLPSLLQPASGTIPPSLNYYVNLNMYDLPVYYDDSVVPTNRIPGLIEFVKSVYEQILHNAKSILGSPNISLPFEGIIPIILSDKKPSKRYPLTKKFLTKKTLEVTRNNNLSEEEMGQRLSEIWDNNYMISPILGEYIYSNSTRARFTVDHNVVSNPFIVIYYTNTTCEDEEDYCAKIRNCFYHEYFHFMHDMYIGPKFRIKTTNSEKVIESLADYYSLIFSLFNGTPADINLANRKYNQWKDLLGKVDWPYAYASYFYLIKGSYLPFSTMSSDWITNGIHDKFKDVLNMSGYSMEKAFNILTI